jgi:asparagine synthetase B (glutamine-hydrolysing)
LIGTGGDEIAGGYYWQNQILKIPYFIRSNIFMLKIKIFHIFSIIMKNKYPFVSNFFSFLGSPLEWHVRSWNHSFGFFFSIRDKIKIFDKIHLLNKKIYEPIKKISIDFMNKFNYLTIKIFSVEIHHKVDLATMNSSIEARAPFFDYNIVEMMMNIKHKIKISQGHKSLLKFFTKNIVDKNILEKKKSGPTLNLENFYPKNKHNIYLNFIKKNKIIIVNYLGIIFYNKFIKNFSDKNLYFENLSKLYAIINFILWYKIKIENSLNNKKNISLDKILISA